MMYGAYSVKMIYCMYMLFMNCV
jgi:hypothetical protein